MDTGRKAGMMNRQLDEKIFIEVNGIRQGMFLQSENTEIRSCCTSMEDPGHRR